MVSKTQLLAGTFPSSPRLGITIVPESIAIIRFGSASGQRFSHGRSCMAMAKVEDKEKEVKLWGGRFEKSVTHIVEKFSESVSYDKRLYKQDINGSRDHASMLAQQASHFLPLACIYF